MSDFIAWLVFSIVSALCAPFMIATIIDRWDAPQYPHSGFSPECPTWEEPENTLPPTQWTSQQ